MIPVNRKIGRFDVIRKLARGGMADVYLGRDEEADRNVALKVIERSPDPDTLECIEAERRGATLQARLAVVDARVVQIYETGDLDEYFYVAMEYIEGEDLAEMIRRAPLPPARAAEIAIAICETLEHAQNLQAAIDGKQYHGIIHGDIKPRNIRIDSQGRVRVLDFGIAKGLSLSRRLTRNDFGSIQYASPERLDTGDVDQMSDLWSVGVVLYEMVTGMQPYQATTTERLDRMIRSRIPAPPAPEPCPEPLRRILRKALAPQAAWRYQSTAEFVEDLRMFQSGGEVRASVEDDLEATRRTIRTMPPELDNGEETRRTTKDVKPPAPSTPPTGVQRVVARTLRILFVAVILYVGYWFASTYLLWNHGQQLEHEIKTEALTDPDQIWQRWAELSKGRSSSLVLYGPRRVVKQKLMAAADSVIATYRNSDAQPVFQNEWERARSFLGKALMVDPGDDSVRGKARLCEGHVARIVGTARRNAATLNDAVAKFNEAQQLMPRSPDPQLGLARLYVYGLRDIDKADAALQQAAGHGHQLGNREKGQLADGYKERADRLWYDTRNVRGLPQERDQVRKAADDYRRALQLYQEIAPYGNASSSIARVEITLESVQQRLKEIQEDSQK